MSAHRHSTGYLLDGEQSQDDENSLDHMARTSPIMSHFTFVCGDCQDEIAEISTNLEVRMDYIFRNPESPPSSTSKTGSNNVSTSTAQHKEDIIDLSSSHVILPFSNGCHKNNFVFVDKQANYLNKEVAIIQMKDATTSTSCKDQPSTSATSSTQKNIVVPFESKVSNALESKAITNNSSVKKISMGIPGKFELTNGDKMVLKYILGSQNEDTHPEKSVPSYQRADRAIKKLVKTSVRKFLNMPDSD